MEDIYIYKYEGLPPTIRAMSFMDRHGDYIIIINACLSPERQEAAYRHEMNHINNNDFYSYEDIRLMEARASGE